MRHLAVFSLVLAVACQADADGDGLTNGEENELGLDKKNADTDGDGLPDGAELDAGADPLVADTDGDGLSDGDEVANGADPTVEDTDGDGYTDRDEVFEGHDPADDRDRIYKGNWPYYFEKDTISGGGWNGDFDNGKRFGRIQEKDQFGDEVDLFDFYNEDGKYVVVDLSTQWCIYCIHMAMWLAGEGDPSGFGQLWPAGPDVVNRGDVYWITLLSQDNFGAPASKSTAKEWADEFPNDNIPVLADDSDGQCIPGYRMSNSECYIDLSGWPSGVLLTPELKVDPEISTNGDWGSVLSRLNELFPE